MAILFLVAGLLSCHSPRPISIALIPRTTGTMQWEPEHGGANAAAGVAGVDIYWNAPTREDDVSAQIAMIDRVVHQNFRGLVLAPDQALGLITPVQRAVAHGLHVVVVGSPLAMPAGGGLSYILNDDVEGGCIAARRVELLLHGKGSVAIVGINPAITGIMIRTRSFEQYLAIHDPDIQIVEKRMGSFNMAHEQQVAEEVLKGKVRLDIIVALMWASTRGAMAAIDNGVVRHSTLVIGFDPEGLPFDAPSLDSLIVQNTREMGYRAVEQISGSLAGKPQVAVIKLGPLLVTRENLNTEQVLNLTSMEWKFPARRPEGSTTR